MIKYFFSDKDDNNIAFHVEDKKADVEKNRFYLSEKNGFKLENLKYMNQTHGRNIHVVTADSKALQENCDALICNEKNVSLMVMVADCIPVLLYDESNNVIAVAHAGRNGTFLNITQKTVQQMISKFLCKEEDIRVVLGPSIQKCCYEVSLEMENTVINKYGLEFTHNRHIDLQAINKKQLTDIGIKSENILVSKICTKCSGENYYSYRLDNKCGRFAGVISLL